MIAAWIIAEAGVVKPLAEVRLFPLPLRMEKAAERHHAAVHQSRVGGEDHVGRARLRLDEFHLRDLRQRTMQLFPLRRGLAAAGAL